MTGSIEIECPHCGTSSTAGDRYCERCGAVVADGDAATCVLCGEAVSAAMEGYCPSCGTRQPVPRDSMEDVGAGGNVAALSDRGRHRLRNEDAFVIASSPSGRVLAVISDGVSSTRDADQASQLAVEAALRAFGDSSDKELAEVVRMTYAAAAEAVNQLGDGSQDASPSCTFLAAAVDRFSVHLASMGDCRAYWLPRAGVPQRLTADDSWANDQILAGTMTPDQAHAHARSHHLTRWLGGDAEGSWQPREVPFTAPGPGRLILCSDGLWNYAPSASDIAAVAPAASPSAVARSLVDYANQRGGRDNTTVVVVNIPCGDDIAASKGTSR
ncbi:MAG: PP2C family serine/threonine-protein phosphatase [Acidimicrobiales bacterium]